MTTPLTPRFLEVLVHDLRTPLNTITLTIRLIDELVNRRALNLTDELEILRDAVAQSNEMLTQVSEYSRLPEVPGNLQVVPFDLRGLLGSLVGEHAGLNPGVAIRLEAPAGPFEVELDPERAQTALRRALGNALAAAERHPIELRLDGAADHAVIRIRIDGPPRSTVQPGDLRGDGFEHLAGTPQERRSLGLAITARISELFGGSARLEVEPGRHSTIVLQWPRRVARAGP